MNVILYYYKSSSPTTSDLQVVGSSSITFTNQGQVSTNTGIYNIQYTINYDSYNDVNNLIAKYTNVSSEFASKLSSNSTGTNYWQMNMNTLNSLRRKFCFQPAQYNYNCPTIIRYTSTSDEKLCSRIIENKALYNDNNDPNNYIKCSQFISDLSGIPTSEAAASFRQFCSENPNSWDCQCYVRNDVPIYQSLKSALTSTDGTSGSGINDTCWYGPCAFQSNIFVPPDLLPQTYCPPVCANVIINEAVGGNINQQNIFMENQCFQNSSDTNAIVNPTNVPVTNYSDTPSPSKLTTPVPTTTLPHLIASYSTKQILIMIGAGFLGLILFYASLLFLTSLFAGKPKYKKQQQ